ncbi:hypothetical protein BHF71_00485 [Vulcanibacillus modesticaldus]|uniref:Cobyrinic acid a,c-diamide synthase n=1 Tax=Vulcanibacillus modesticaldus TaxID=337097 RepID=A0A1D2YXI1_9BACI|nr:MinD/ParA family protein [Vulcanibacillus modesticaldus]OEG00419.1 hypothetical protein BHF71_00485 [Vulcanibacillus modesticaldus]
MKFDQASDLRKKIALTHQEKSPTKIITITSGKGGVGKSNFTLNFAFALLEKGHRVMILDADIGFANIDVLLGIAPKYTLLDMLNNHLEISEIIEKGPNGLEFISGGSDLNNIFNITKNKLPYLFNQLSLLNGKIDYLLIDTGAGINEGSKKIILSSDDIFLVTTTEPTSITDSYAMIKWMISEKKDIKINLIINQIANEREGNSTANRIKKVTERFLDYSVNILGFIHSDDTVSKAVKKQEPFYLSYPNSRVSKNIRTLVDKYTTSKDGQYSTGITAFLEKMTLWLLR